MQLPVVNYSADLTAELALTPAARLRSVQSAALQAIREERGGFFAIGVGQGKSVICLLAATVLDAKRAIIFLPASTRGTMERARLKFASLFRLIADIRVVNYSALSRPEGTTLLARLTAGVPDRDIVIACDECHRIADRTSSRTGRVIRHMVAHPETALVALSGTVANPGRSIRDSAHIAALALRQRSPVPQERHTLRDWAEVIDLAGRPNRMNHSAISPLVAWARGQGADLPRARQRAARVAYRLRFTTAPGVVMTQKGSVDASLYIQPIVDVQLPPAVRQALANVDNGIDPEGIPILDDLQKWRLRTQITMGYHYRYVWPGGIVDYAWLEARADWARQVRAELDARADVHYDSPRLVQDAVERGLVPVAARVRRSTTVLERSYLRWCSERAKPEPPRHTVWLDQYIVDYAVAWAARQKQPVIVWFPGSAALEDAFRARGMTTYGEGVDPPEHPAVTCACSVNAHGEGKNLQAWSRCLVLSWPSNGKTIEQLLGRLHRQGQLADEVYYCALMHTPELRAALERSRTGARWMDDITGNEQKIHLATALDPL